MDIPVLGLMLLPVVPFPQGPWLSGGPAVAAVGTWTMAVIHHGTGQWKVNSVLQQKDQLDTCRCTLCDVLVVVVVAVVY